MSAKTSASERARRDLPFTPDYAIPPGETLLETIEALDMSQAELAERTGRPLKTINEIIKGKTAITPETALQFERVLGAPASFWNNRERHYQEALARIEEREHLRGETGWLDKVPWRELVKRGLIPACKDRVDTLIETLRFFGAATPQACEGVWTTTQAAFRHSPTFKSQPGALAAWLRLGEVEAQQIECAPYDRDKFRDALRRIRSLTVAPIEEAWTKLVDLCAAAGVAVVLIREFKETRVAGVTRWLSPHKASIQLSARYLTDDHFWFAFFHEAAHILLHGKREVFLEGDRGDKEREQEEKEREANDFAANFLIPARDMQAFVAEGVFGPHSIEAFARQQGIAPGIVVGQLQHRGHLPFSRCNELKVRYPWNDETESAA